MLGRAVAALGVGALAACTLVVDTDGLTGGAASADGGGAEGSTDANAPAPESGPGDAMGSADADAGASDAPFCVRTANDASLAHFCADFDEGFVAVGWSGQSLSPGTIVVDDTSSVSPPSSARFEMDAGALGCSYTSMDKHLGARCRLGYAS
jgi:hypothetical protein